MSIIKGKDLKNIKLYKVLRNDFTHYNFKYRLGKNVDILPFNPRGHCSEGGLYFSDIYYIYKFFNLGDLIVDVSIDGNEYIYVDKYKYKAHSISIFNPRKLDDIINQLYKNDINIAIQISGYTLQYAKNPKE